MGGLIVVVIFFIFKPNNEIGSESGAVSPQVLGDQVTQVNIGDPPEDLKEFNVLLLGYGGAGHEGGFLTDVIQLVHIDFEKKRISLISIPRDLWVTLPNGVEAKINRAFSLDDGESLGKSVKEMVEVVTGLKVDNFIAVDFVSFQRIIGYELHGIEVEVAEPLIDEWYPIKGEELNTCGKTPDEVAKLSTELSGFELESQFTCRYEKLNFPKGSVHMEGGDALKYVRSRHGSAAGDFSRSRRQHEVLAAIKKKLFSLDAVKLAPSLYDAYVQHVQTDLNVDAIRYIQPALVEYNSTTFNTVVLSTDTVFDQGKNAQGQFVLTPKSSWEAVHQYIVEHL